MTWLQLVASMEDEHTYQADAEQTYDAGLSHRAKVLRSLVSPQARTGSAVCADLYFASVASAEILINLGLRLVGAIRTATRRLLYAELMRPDLKGCGDLLGLLSTREGSDPWALSFVWMDRARRFFISTCSRVAPGAPYSRTRLRQVSEESDVVTERVELVVAKPGAFEIY